MKRTNLVIVGSIVAFTCQPGTPAAADRRQLAKSSVPSVDDFVERSYDDAKGHKLPYRLFIPAGASSKGGATPTGAARGGAVLKKYPLLVFLHGSGGRGSDNRGQLADQDAALVFVRAENQARWPLFMVAPQCPRDQQWVDMPWGTATGTGRRPKNPTWPMAAAVALVDDLVRRHPEIDPDQLYVTGMSMGGYGTWDAAVRHPAKWKAAVIVCGGYDASAATPLKGTPLRIWAFHAADDQVVPVGRTREMIAAVRGLGLTPRYTEYPASDSYGHSSWVPAYSDPGLLPWMFGPR